MERAHYFYLTLAGRIGPTVDQEFHQPRTGDASILFTDHNHVFLYLVASSSTQAAVQVAWPPTRLDEEASGEPEIAAADQLRYAGAERPTPCCLLLLQVRVHTYNLDIWPMLFFDSFEDLRNLLS